MPGPVDAARRRLHAAVSSVVCAIVLVALSVHVGNQGYKKVSLDEKVNEEFIHDLEKSFAPHPDNRPGHGGKEYNYFNVCHVFVSFILMINKWHFICADI